MCKLILAVWTPKLAFVNISIKSCDYLGKHWQSFRIGVLNTGLNEQ